MDAPDIRRADLVAAALIGDGPIDDLDQVWITVGAVELNMAGGKKEVVLDTPQSIELLSLRNLTEVLHERRNADRVDGDRDEQCQPASRATLARPARIEPLIECCRCHVKPPFE